MLTLNLFDYLRRRVLEALLAGTADYMADMEANGEDAAPAVAALLERLQRPAALPAPVEDGTRGRKK